MAATSSTGTADMETIFVEELCDDKNPTRVMLQNFSRDQTLRQFKIAIAAKLGQPSSWESLYVIFAEQFLDDLDRTLASYNIVNSDTIFFVRSLDKLVALADSDQEEEQRQVKLLSNLFFHDLDGKTQTLHGVPADSSVSEVIAKYGNEKAVDTEWLRFLWGGKQIWPTSRPNDTRSLRDYGLGDNSTIHVTARVRGGIVQFGV